MMHLNKFIRKPVGWRDLKRVGADGFAEPQLLKRT